MKLDTSNPVDSPLQLVPNRVKKKFKTGWLSWLLVLLTLGGVSYVVYRQLVIVPQQQARRSIPTASPERQTLPITISANGTVKPERSINVSPQESGILKKLLVKEGDTVKQGQILAEMDDSDLQGQLTQARGQLAQAQANLQKAQVGNRPQDIASSQAQLEEAQANLQKAQVGNRPQEIGQAQALLKSAQANLSKAEDDFRRNQQLYNSGAISLQTVNQKRADRDSAQAQVAQAQQSLALQQAGSRSEDIAQAQAVVRQRQQALALLKAGSRKEDIDAARAQVTAARGSLQTIETKINQTILKAPFDGVVTQKFSDPGAFVTPTTSGSAVSSATSSSILSLASTNQIEANIAEVNISKIKLGQKVIIRADAYPGQTFEGRVSQISAQATVEQNVTSFRVKVAIVSDTKKLLRSGMNVTADFQVGQLNNALVVPTAAVVRQENATGVFVIRPDRKRPVFTPIETGATVNNFTEVRSGLKGSEKVSLSFPPGTRPQSRPRGGLLPGMPGGGSGGGRSSGGGSGGGGSSRGGG